LSACTFFGHRDCPDSVKQKLEDTLVQLITENGVDRFYVGNQGNFDALVYRVLCELRGIYPHITVTVVLAYMPPEETANRYGSDAILPEGIEAVPKRYAISWRNKWMINQSEYVVTYVTRSFGGAAISAEIARKNGLTKIAIEGYNL